MEWCLRLAGAGFSCCHRPMASQQMGAKSGERTGSNRKSTVWQSKPHTHTHRLRGNCVFDFFAPGPFATYTRTILIWPLLHFATHRCLICGRGLDICLLLSTFSILSTEERFTKFQLLKKLENLLVRVLDYWRCCKQGDLQSIKQISHKSTL